MMSFTNLRLTFLAALAASGTAICAQSASFHDTTAAAVEQANQQLWEDRIDPHGIVYDFVGALPTPEDCELGKPNAIGWWSPIEDGPMFTGLYLPAACERARRTGDAADKAKARRLAQGLMKCASVSDVPGFIARGVGSDGKCHYPLGSDDQTHPWFMGLHAYCTSGIPTQEERGEMIAKMVEVAEVLESTGWRCPAAGAFKGDFRGEYRGHLFRDAVRYLHLLKLMHEVTGDEVWLTRYHKARAERPHGSAETRVEICEIGYARDHEAIKNIDDHQQWIYVGSQAALAALVKWETDETIRAQYKTGLVANTKASLKSLAVYADFDNNDTKVFGNADWRAVYSTWFPQPTQAEAERLARIYDKEKRGERKSYEQRYMQNPLAAAAIASMAGNNEGREVIEAVIRHYDYAKIHMSTFFFAECAWYALPLLSVATATDPVSSVTSTPGLVAFWDFVKREPQGAGRFTAHVPTDATNDYPLDAANYIKDFWGAGREATYADFPLLGRGPFGNAIRIVKETDENFRPFLFVPRSRLHDTPLDIKGEGKSVTVVVWAIRESGNHALAGIWHEGTDLKEKSTATIAKVERGQRQYALFAGLNKQGSACGHVSENGASSFLNKYALHKSNSADISPEVPSDSPAEVLDASWQCFAMSFDHEKDELTGWLNGVSGDRWLDQPKKDKLISFAYNACMQGHYAKLPGKQDGEDEAFPKDQYYNPPEGEPLSVKVLRESADERVELREYRFTKIAVTLRGGQEVSRDLVALRLNPWWYPHDLYTPKDAQSGGPFTIGRVIHSSRSVGFTGWIGGVAVFDRALSAEELKKLSDLRR